eukprot:11738756-Alexandrium_andersonii.AAC.1
MLVMRALRGRGSPPLLACGGPPSVFLAWLHPPQGCCGRLPLLAACLRSIRLGRARSAAALVHAPAPRRCRLARPCWLRSQLLC